MYGKEEHRIRGSANENYSFVKNFTSGSICSNGAGQSRKMFKLIKDK